MDEVEAVSKTTGPEEEEATADTEEEAEEELIQLVHRGEVHEVPYSQVRSFRTRYPSAVFLSPLQRNPQPVQLKLPYMRASTSSAETVGSNSAMGRTNDSGENVPRTEDSRSEEKSIHDSDADSEDKEEEDEWANYWPPSPQSSDTEDEESEEVSPETDEEQLALDNETAQLESADQTALKDMEVKRNTHEHTRPERNYPPVDVWLKFP
jgi:hypothetical protein